MLNALNKRPLSHRTIRIKPSLGGKTVVNDSHQVSLQAGGIREGCEEQFVGLTSHIALEIKKYRSSQTHLKTSTISHALEERRSLAISLAVPTLLQV